MTTTRLLPARPYSAFGYADGDVKAFEEWGSIKIGCGNVSILDKNALGSHENQSVL
jgi:hypothetical protein